MHHAIEATDIIYNDALQVVSQLGVDPKLIPLIMGTVTQRLESFAIGDLARELSKAVAQSEQATEEESEE